MFCLTTKWPSLLERSPTSGTLFIHASRPQSIAIIVILVSYFLINCSNLRINRSIPASSSLQRNWGRAAEFVGTKYTTKAPNKHTRPEEKPPTIGI